MSDYLGPALKCFCGRTYRNEVDLGEHRRARGHFSTHKCGSHCKHQQVFENPIRIQFCNYCGKECERDDILKDHRTVTGHCFCSECDRVFISQEALKEHLQTQIHASEFRCCNCNIDFKDIHALNAHMMSRAHRKPLAVKQKTPNSLKVTLTNGELSCKDCNRTFKSASSFRQHRASVKHKPLSNLTCPIGGSCTKHFTSPSALIQHLEDGGCNSKMTRDEIYRLIQFHDSERLIHNHPESKLSTPQSLLPSEPSPTDRPLSDESNWSLITSPSILSLNESVTGWSSASELETRISGSQCFVEALASSRFRCPLCPKTRKGFAAARDLEQHMMSPVHFPKVYHCPTNMFSEGRASGPEKPPKFFSTLGGLAQHLESGACQGGKETFNKIVKFIEQRLELLGFAGICLLLSGYRDM